MNSLFSSLLLLSAFVALASTLDVRTDSMETIKDGMTKDLNEANEELIKSVHEKFPNLKIGRSYSDSVENSDGGLKEGSAGIMTFEEFKKKYNKKYGYLFTSTTNTFSSSDNCNDKKDNTSQDSSCEISATWDFAKDGVCFKSTYYKKAYLPGSANASKGVEKCGKTLCGATEPATTDCKEAFGSMFSSIPTVNL
ncbi:hypothetical protein CAEBREN_13905 [Caenorhabditis brenneri]|uniref:Uncharacterized protein n=1 Tax=Caenorhabditis brenneri TaxID=135651 RepID=G0PE90_CAEBE|nr:hypothetical protein CAEBREN_13905 [Caenorhabditis brenneri]